MQKHHPQNERIKWQYLQFLEDAKRMKRESVDQAAAAVAAFEVSTNWKDFRLFHIEQARKFKRDLNAQVVAGTDKPLAVATKVSRLRAVKAFFQWPAGRPGYSSKLTYSDMDYFNPSNNDGRIAGAKRERPVPSLEQIRHVLTSMPTTTALERRNRALIAFAILTGARDAAIASFSLKHVDSRRRSVFQDAREVKTKNRKTFMTWFYPVGADIEAIFTGWLEELQTVHLYGPDDPLFPATAMALDSNSQFHAVGLSRKHWRDAGPIRKIFRESFEVASLPCFNPHSFRKTIWRLGEKVFSNGADARAWSLNLGHDNVLTSFTSYGPMSADERGDILTRLAAIMPGQVAQGLDPSTIEKVIALLRLPKRGQC